MRRARIGGEACREHGRDPSNGFGRGLLLAHVEYFLSATRIGSPCRGERLENNL
jgi:hypothetical protein